MYFQEPQQLLDIFTALEEQNLFLIQNAQETEEAMEEVEQKFAESKTVMEAKTSALKWNIWELEAQITEKKTLIAIIDKTNADEEEAAYVDYKLNWNHVFELVRTIMLCCYVIAKTCIVFRYGPFSFKKHWKKHRKPLKNIKKHRNTLRSIWKRIGNL